MTDLSGIRRGVNKAYGELGRIDMIVSNARYVPFGAAEELSDEQVAHPISTNLIGPIQLVRAALPISVRRGVGGSIGLSHLRRPGGSSGRFSLPRQQMGA